MSNFQRVLLFCILLLLSVPMMGQISLTRGPYLQMPTSASMTVRWRTDAATDSRVRYGASPTALTNTVDDPASVTEHSINITGLTPYTKYYYSVGDQSSTLSGGDSLHHFTTSPVIGTVQPIRVWAIGDFGKGSTKQRQVHESYTTFAGNDHTDVWLWLGDNAYDSGTDSEYQTKVFDGPNGYEDIFKYMPFMPAPGNHDYLSVSPPTSSISPPTHSGPYYDMVDVPTQGEIGGEPSGMEAFYSFDYGNTHFISINSEIGSLLSSTNCWIGVYEEFNIFASNFSGSPFTDWLEDDLAANDKRWTVAYWHQPPYTDGSHEAGTFWEVYMEAMRNNIVPILEQYNVDLVLCGHSHVYERSFLIKGHYDDPGSWNPSTMLVDGSSGNLPAGEAYTKNISTPGGEEGTVYVVCGNSASTDSDPDLEYPAMYTGYGCDTCIGSFVLDIHGDTLHGRYLNAYGNIEDDFTILKTGMVTANDPVVIPDISDVEVYPIPFSNEFTITYTLPHKEDIAIDLTDVNGKQTVQVFQGTQGVGPQSVKVPFKSLGLAAGSYILRIRGAEKVLHQQIINGAK